jgi:hypothetical protein
MVYLGALPNRSMRVAQVKAYTAGLYWFKALLCWLTA